MIHLVNVTKYYPINHGRNKRIILDQVNLTIQPGEKWGILGRNGAGKSTMIRVISGAEKPTSGVVFRGMSISWPLAFGDAFQSSLTGRDNVRLICRFYGVDFERAIKFVEDFSELGAYLWEPISNYSSGMSARLAFAISMAIEFDCYLIDEVMAVGDYRFLEKCNFELFQKRANRAMIIVSHNPDFIKAHCDQVAVLYDGKLKSFTNIEEGNEFYHYTNQSSL